MSRVPPPRHLSKFLIFPSRQGITAPPASFLSRSSRLSLGRGNYLFTALPEIFESSISLRTLLPCVYVCQCEQTESVHHVKDTYAVVYFACRYVSPSLFRCQYVSVSVASRACVQAMLCGRERLQRYRLCKISPR